MKITYIYHSAYCIETENFDIIIDFYKDSVKDAYIYKNILPKNKKLYVLSTHSHSDHYNPEVLKWKEKNKNITYIFSKDILTEGVAQKDDALYLDKLEEYRDEDVFVKAYGSTDSGGSFYIETEEKKIFHAGDLNNWHWNEESTPKEIKEAEDWYQRELDILYRDVKEFDFVMFPIDPRLGIDFMKGAQQFVEKFDVKYLAPMHFANNFEKVLKFEPIAKANNSIFFANEDIRTSINI